MLHQLIEEIERTGTSEPTNNRTDTLDSGTLSAGIENNSTTLSSIPETSPVPSIKHNQWVLGSDSSLTAAAEANMSEFYNVSEDVSNKTMVCDDMIRGLAAGAGINVENEERARSSSQDEADEEDSQSSLSK